MDNPLISVIIPVYNVEKYLDKCIQSIIDQTYENLEIILVDDKSSDNSASICDKYVLEDKRIKVIHREKNEGAAAARNSGLSIARGDYLCFVDSDDYLPNSSIKDLYTPMAANNCQYCGIINNKNLKNIHGITIIDIKKEIDKFFLYITSPGSYSVYAKLYNSNIIRNNDISFDVNLKSMEDTPFIRKYLSYCSTICLISNEVYCYNTNNSNSLSKKAYPDYALYYIEKLKVLDELCDRLDIEKRKKTEFISKRALHGFKISMDHYFTHYNDKQQLKKFIENCIDFFYPWISPEFNGGSKFDRICIINIRKRNINHLKFIFEKKHRLFKFKLYLNKIKTKST